MTAPRCHNPACGGVIPPPTYRLSSKQLRRRKFCTKPCWDSYLRDKQIALAGSRRFMPIEKRLPIPDSARRVARWDGVPARCWHCGGMWRQITGGVGCLSCGRDLYVASELVPLGFETGAVPVVTAT